MQKLLENKEFLGELESLIEKYTKPIEKESFIEKGKKYICIKDFLLANGSVAYIKGNLYMADGRGLLPTEEGTWMPFSDEVAYKYFRSATESEIPHKPKFKKGDWVALIANVHEKRKLLHIIDFDGKCYFVEDEEGNTGTPSHAYVEDSYYLWTVQDAKDGDVLVVNESPVIFKNRTVNNGIDTYCRLEDGDEQWEFHSSLKCITIQDEDVQPATKEQRDLLFSKMKEAGYEWDADKKELKKIVKRWRDGDNLINGWWIRSNGKISPCLNQRALCKKNYGIFATEAQAKSALAMARISQIMANDERFGGVVTDEEWGKDAFKYVIVRVNGEIEQRWSRRIHHFLAFHTEEQRDLFLEENEDLVREYLMLPKVK